MIFTKKNKKEDNFMLYIPQRKVMDWEIRNNNVTLIFHHDKTAEKFLRWLSKKPYTTDIELDNLGSEVWLLIDGRNSVYEIGQRILRKFGKDCEPVYDRLIMFLRYLNRRGWIGFTENSTIPAPNSRQSK